jgi:tetratricopeptide (TPR) repeat protein
MKKIILLLAVVVLLSGCTSKTKQIQEFSSQAESLVANEKYDDAISIYNKILELKDSKIYRDKITEVENIKYAKQAEEYEKEARFDDAIALYTKILQS